MEKLINEYEHKIKELDNLIETILFEIKLIRRDGSSAMTSEEWSSVKKVADAKRQCYVQFIKDLESL